MATVSNDQQIDLLDRYRQVRSVTESLCEGLQPEDTVAQSMTDASPAKWHLAHTNWFFETLVLEKAINNYTPVNPGYRVMFNSYYNSIGEQYLRRHRGLITRPGLQEVLEYRSQIDMQMIELLSAESALDASIAAIIEVGIQHEQQHQELILTDLKHLFSHNPLYPVYRQSADAPANHPGSMRWQEFETQLYSVGHTGRGFAFDNESPRHQVQLNAFAIASRPVTNGEYFEFMQDQAYQRAELWLSDAWALLQQEQWQAPLYWQQIAGRWQQFTLAGLHPVREEEPVSHISYYEADAYAHWAGARLPTEFEWEVAAAGQPVQGNLLEQQEFHPRAGEDNESDLLQIYGDVWEWTQSAYAPYPGYRPPAGELAEYNGKFMCNQMVLRGGSCVTPQSHIRSSYRNFFYPQARWQFSGLRLARDI